MFCPKCGNQHNDDARFCPKCGTGVGDTQKNNIIDDKKNDTWKIVAIISAAVVIIIILIVVLAKSCNNKNESDISHSVSKNTTTVVETTTTNPADTTSTTTAAAQTTTAPEIEYHMVSTNNGEEYYYCDGKLQPTVYKISVGDNKFYVEGSFSVAETEEDLWKGNRTLVSKKEYTFEITSSTELITKDYEDNKTYYTQEEFNRMCQNQNGLGLFLHVKGNKLISARLSS